MNNFCLYHSNCKDGWAASWVVWKKFGNKLQFVPVQYGEELPQLEYPIDKLFIVDFSYSRDELLKLEEVCKEIILIDHHTTAQENLKNWEPKNGTKIYDMDHSGAVLTFQYLFPDEPIDQFMLYIQDRDLWSFKLPDSRAFSAGLDYICKADPSRYHDFDKYSFISVPECIKTGKPILDYQNGLVESICKHVEVIENDDGHFVGTVNSCILQSEIGEYIYTNIKNKDGRPVDYADIFFLKGGEIIHSLRSNTMDVGAIAKVLGGGGHSKASGYKEKI